MKLAIHILIYLNIMIIFSSCGSNSSGNDNDNNTNSGYRVIQYQSGNNISKYEYNDIGQKIKTIQPDGDILTYIYNTNNQLISLKKIKKSGNVYNSLFIYNNINQLIKQEEGSGTIYTFTYDNNGNLIEIYNQTTNTKIKTYFYNTLNQRIKIVYSTGLITDISYNGIGQIIKSEQTNSKGEMRHNTYSYNINGKITQGMQSNGSIKTYTYENKSCANAGFLTTSKAFLSARCKK